ncbi:MAG: hypothetical protein KDD10_24625 [Phaeodactylibacter sp.]|nr:hypothetical protein [Phaeodactylibacter sp.]
MEAKQMTAPQIFLAFSNKQDNYLEKLNDELLYITDAAIGLKQAGRIDYDTLPNADSEALFGRLRILKDVITVFHYAGHAKSLYFELRESQGQGGDYGIEQLSSLLTGSRLKLVFLNGCSTKGMVREVFDKTTARAVIATSVDIGDDLASKFAKKFYEAFIGGLYSGNTLQEAFDAAVLHLGKKAEGIKRGSLSLEDIEMEEDSALEAPCPWGLFNKDEEILNWKINPGGAADAEIDEGLKIKLEGQEESIKEAYSALDELKSYYALLQAFQSLEKTDAKYQELLDAEDFEALKKIKKAREGYPEIEKAREAVRLDIDAARKEYFRLCEEKSRLWESHHDKDKKSCIKHALFNINFNDQKPRILSGIRKEKASAKAFAYVIQGTPNSAHRLLVDFLSKDRRIAPEVQVCRVDLGLFSKSVAAPAVGKKGIFEKVLLELAGDAPPESDFGESHMIKKIRDASAYNHLVLVFDGVYEQLLKAGGLKQSLEEFWAFLKEGLFPLGDTPGEDALAAQAQQYYNVLLLINLIKSSENKPFQGLPEGFSLLEEIPRIRPGELMIWQNQIEGGYLSLEKEEYAELFGDEGEHVLPTIKKLCERALGEEGPGFFNKNFSIYKYSEFTL